MMNDESTPSPSAGEPTATCDMTAKRTTASLVIAADPATLFGIVSDASMHPVIDGSGTVKGSRDSETERLTMGSRFSMKMRWGVPYSIGNTVVEFEPDRRIAWQHLGRHRWRYEFEAVEGGTLVTETFDWSTALAPKVLELAGFPQRHVEPMKQTLRNLAAFVRNRSSAL